MRRICVWLIAVGLCWLANPAARPCAQTEDCTSVADYTSVCGTITRVSSKSVKSGEEVTVNVNVRCLGSGWEVGASLALPDKVLLNGTPVPRSAVRSTLRFIYSTFYATGKPQPVPLPGAAIDVPIGDSEITFTINPAAPPSCIKVTGTPKTSSHRATGPFVSLAGVITNGNPWSVHTGFEVNRPRQPLTVNSSGDDPDSKPGDESCDTGKLLADGKTRECTLRAAIEESEKLSTRETITFDVPNGRVEVKSALPEITDPVTIDGTTQKGGRVDLDGIETRRSLGTPVHGLTITSGGTTVKGLVIQSFTGSGILILGLGSNLIENNYIGTNRTGTTAAGNGGVEEASAAGVWIGDSASNTVFRNVISGNAGHGIAISGSDATGNIVQGNFIGTNAAGTEALPNGRSGVSINSAGNTVGGTTKAARNVISGNTGTGQISISANGNVVQGNYIGTDVSGRQGLSDGDDGILVAYADGTIIGGSGSGAGNLIGSVYKGINVNSGGRNTRIEGNTIGSTDPKSGLQNTFGVSIYGGTKTVIGGEDVAAQNTIVGNDVGIQIYQGTTHSILGNSIFSNRLGIDLGSDGATKNDIDDTDDGPNTLLNFPVLESAFATRVSGTLRTGRSGRFRIEFFRNRACNRSGYGEGEVFVHSITQGTTPVIGIVQFTDVALPVVPAGNFLTATATDPEGNTSEFSRCAMVQGIVQTDLDGMADEIEDNAPGRSDTASTGLSRREEQEQSQPAATSRRGDGNADGTPDKNQSHVTSFPTTTGVMVTLEAPSNLAISNVEPSPETDVRTAPPGTDFPAGTFQFGITSASSALAAPAFSAGAATTVTLFLPADMKVTGYWNYGPEAGNTTPHWYPFLFNGTTGAQILADRVLLHFVDGQRGDHDLAANGRILTVGGPVALDVVLEPTAGSAGGGTKVKIVGTNFAAGTKVSFGGATATSIAVASDTELTAVTAPHAAGAVDVVITSPGGLSVTAPGAFTYLAAPPTASTDTDRDGMPDAWELQFGLDPTVRDSSADPDGDGVTNGQERSRGTHPRGFVTRYLAEGATGAFFDQRIALANPGALPAVVLLRFLKADGRIVSHVVTLNGSTRSTVDPETIAGVEAAEFSTVIEADAEIVVDRTMTWDARGYGSHAETAIGEPGELWYLAEGATHSGFDLFYLIQNPTSNAAEVLVRYLRPAPNPPVDKTYTVRANSRFTIWVNRADPGLASTDVSAILLSANRVPIIVERAMYLPAGGLVFGAGHESAGVRAPATRWFLAEGATGPFFDLFVLVANPNKDAAQLTATYLLPDGTTLTKDYVVAPQSRFNIWVDREDARLADTAVSTTIVSTNGVPVIVERAMWWPGPAATWREAHNSPGATATGTKWALAEGQVGGPNAAETYILIANTSAFAGSAKVTLLFEDGTTSEQTFALNPNSRFNVAVASTFPAAAGKRFGAIVESGGTTPAQIVVERAMYSNAGGVIWAAGSNALATRLH